MAPSSIATSVAPNKPMNVLDELKLRESWIVGSVMEVFSSSAAKWYIAQVKDVGTKGTPNAHMITAQFVGDNGQILQKSQPRSDVQLATFGKNTRQMPPNFQKVASESRPGQFSYQDSESGQKYQTKELAWENYYVVILKCEQAQTLLKQQCLNPQQAAPASAQAPAERLAAERMQPQALQAAPTMSLAPAPKAGSGYSSDLYAGAHGPDPVLAKSLQAASHHASYSASNNGSVVGSVVNQPRARDVYSQPRMSSSCTPSTVSASPPQNVQKPQTMGDLSSLAQPQTSNLQPSKPFPGYGQSFAVGTSAGYDAYLASQGMA